MRKQRFRVYTPASTIARRVPGLRAPSGAVSASTAAAAGSVAARASSSASSPRTKTPIAKLSANATGRAAPRGAPGGAAHGRMIRCRENFLSCRGRAAQHAQRLQIPRK